MMMMGLTRGDPHTEIAHQMGAIASSSTPAPNPKPRPSIDQSVSFYLTDDLKRTDKFWRNMMGLRLALDQGVCRVYRSSSTGFIGFCERKGCSTPDGTITLVSDEVDEWHEYLKDKGLQFETGPPGTSPGFKHDYNDGPALNPRFNIYHFFVRDDRGQLVEVQQFRDPKWPKP